tara:strand:- start:20564 stop:22039 length:1476 start_codon:yes stop_codon:yes gene_type:complete
MRIVASCTNQPGVEAWPLAERLGWAGRFGRLIGENEATLCGLAGAEVHKTRWECLTADVVPLVNACRWHRRHGARILRDRRVPGGGLLALGQRHRVRREPLGRVGIIATWNYPLLLAGQHVLQAMVAGNRVVLKPSERSPRTQRRLAELAWEAGCPRDRLEVVDADRTAGAALVAGDFGPIDHLVFTGSTEVGRAIAAELAPRLITSTLELSGRDSALVLDDADAALAARTIWWAATVNGGQTCMAPRRALVHAAVYERFLRAMAPLASRAAVRHLIDAAAASKVSGQVSEALSRGGRSISGVFEPARGEAFRPVAVVDCPADAPLVDGRHFGPALAVIPCGSLDEMLAIHDRIDQRLVTSVFTRYTRRGAALAGRLGSSGVMVNDAIMPTAHPEVSVGGVGASGWGLTQGRRGLEALTREVFVARTSRRIRPPLDAPDEAGQERGARTLLRLAGAGRRTTGTGDRPPAPPPGTKPTTKPHPAPAAGGPAP